MNKKKPAKKKPATINATTKREPVLAPCHFCKKKVDKDDMFCHGCRTVVCSECDVSLGEYGPGHGPEAHLVDPGY